MFNRLFLFISAVRRIKIEKNAARKHFVHDLFDFCNGRDMISLGQMITKHHCLSSTPVSAF